MTKFTQQDVTEEDGLPILRVKLGSRYFLTMDWGVKDKYPDIDGMIRLRNPNGTYLNKYLHFQLKSLTQLDPRKFYCERDILDYLTQTNVPTLLFVVDVPNQKAYWFFIDKKVNQTLQLTEDKKGRTLDVSSNEINNNSPELNQLWQEFAKGDNYVQISESLQKMVLEFHRNVKNSVGLLYLLQRSEKDKLPELFSSLLQVDQKEIEVIITRLQKEEIISTTTNLYLVENDQIGIECLFELAETFDFKKIPELFKDKSDLKLIHRQLAKIEHPKVNAYFKDLFKEILAMVEDPKNNDDIDINLEILEEFAFRDPKASLKIIEKVINPPKVVPPKPYKGKFGSFTGQSYSDLVLRSLGILNELRYLESKAVLRYYLQVAKTNNNAYKRKLEEVIENMAEYNLGVLRRIGYGQQSVLITEIEKLSKKSLAENLDTVLAITKELISSNFEGRSMSDYRTLTISFGGLKPNEQLKDIRSRTVQFLIKIFNQASDLKIKIKIMQILQEATYTPRQGDYSDELKDLIMEDTMTIIKFYSSIFGNLENQLIQEIDEQVTSLIRRHGQGTIPELDALDTRIAADTEYDLFRLFVGYDYKFAKTDDWRDLRDERDKKMQEYINAITEAKYDDLRKLVKTIAKDYEDIDPSKFQYFFQLLFEIGKQKPELAFKLINDEEELLSRFLYHPLIGLWESKRNDLARVLVKKWLSEERYIVACAILFSSQNAYDKELLKEVAAKASKTNDIIALNNVIKSTSTHFKTDKDLRNLFLDCIKKLTQLKNTSWISLIWFRDKDILKELNEEGIKAVLSNLVHTQDVDHYVEEILMVICKKHPEDVINYFFERLKLKEKTEKIDRYDPLPFRLHELDGELRKNSDVIVPIMLSWLEKDDLLRKMRVGHFFKSVYPSFSEELESALINIIHSKDTNKAVNVMSVLRSYYGETFLHKTIKEFIKSFPLDKSLKGDLFVILSSTGTVSGEYGLANAYKQKKEEIQSWKESPDQPVKVFAQEYEQYLDKIIESETRRADDMVALMKKGVF